MKPKAYVKKLMARGRLDRLRGYRDDAKRDAVRSKRMICVEYMKIRDAVKYADLQGVLNGIELLRVGRIGDARATLGLNDTDEGRIGIECIGLVRVD